jgi:hypothetical protein
MLTSEEVQSLLDRLCVDLGFCLPPAEHNRLCDDPPQDVVLFTDAVFRAEGLNPEHADRHLYRQVRDYVAEAFGGSARRHDA